MSKIQLNQSYLMGLYNTPSSELPTSELAKRINDDCGTTLSPAQVRHLFNVQLNSPLKNRPRKQGTDLLSGIEVVMDLEEVDAATTNEDVENVEVTEAFGSVESANGIYA